VFQVAWAAWAAPNHWPQTMNAPAFLGVDADPRRIERRIETGYCDRMAAHLVKRYSRYTTRMDANARSRGLVGIALSAPDGAAWRGAGSAD